MGRKPPKARPRTRGRKGALRPCLVCGVVTAFPYCAEHAREYDVSVTQARRSKAKAEIMRRRRIKKTGSRCEQCGHHDPSARTLQLDHRIPLEDGGADTPENTWLLCQRCHLDKTSAEQKVARKRSRTTTGNPMQQE